MIEPEAFLRTCLRVHAGQIPLARLRDEAEVLAGGWTAAAERIEFERLGPLMHRIVGGRGIAPPALESSFRLAYRNSALRNRLLLGELGACLRAFAAQDVRVIVLKGAALAEDVYGDVALRPMSDLDLLGEPGDRAAVSAALESCGYAPANDGASRGGAAAPEAPLRFRKRGQMAVEVELHRALFPSSRRRRRGEPERDTRSARIAGEDASILSPGTQVLHLAGSLAMHGSGPRLLWTNDIAALLRRHGDELDWGELIAGARRHELSLALGQIVIELAEDWDVAVPAAVLEELRRLRASREASSAARASGRDGSQPLPECESEAPALPPETPPQPPRKRDLTGADALVTCIYNGLAGTRFGGRLNRDAMYRESLMTIAGNSALRVYCFAPAADIPAHRQYFAPCPTEIDFVPLALSEVPEHPRILRIKERHPEDYASIAWRERCVEIMWGKFHMLERVLAAAPDARYVYWIDAGLANVNIVSTKYIGEEDLDRHRLSAVHAAFSPRLFGGIRDFVGDRLLAIMTTRPDNRGIPEKYNARPYASSNAVVGGLFGGPRRRVAELCARFRDKVEAILADEVLYFEESILTGILADEPDLFRVFSFDTWYHEGWATFDPTQVNFSNFFDLMLGTPAPERILRLPWFR